jgi:hypothetical protein
MIIVAPYDPAWPEQFAAEAEGIRKVFGNLALRIEHVGSTSVPGLAAKPVIDIQVSVLSLEPGNFYRTRLEMSEPPIRYCTRCRVQINALRIARGAFYCGNECRMSDKRERRQWKADRFCRLCGKAKKRKPARTPDAVSTVGVEACAKGAHAL